MKICFILPAIYPLVTGGAEIFNYYLINKLSETQKVSYIGLDDLHNPQINFFKLIRIKPTKFFFPLQILLKIIRYRKNFDIIHVSFMRGHFFHWLIYPILNLIWEIKYFITIHDGNTSISKPKWIYYSLFKRAHNIVCVSKNMKEKYSKITQRQTIYIPPLIPFTTCDLSVSFLKDKYHLPESSKIFIYVGSLKPLKNPKTILDGFLRITNELIKYNSFVVIAGGGELEEKLIELVKENRMEDRIRIIGKVNYEQICEIYKIANFYIISSFYEGTSISLLEAMSNSLPIIAANSPGITDILIDNYNCLLFNPNSSEDLSNKVIKLLKDPQFCVKISKNVHHDFVNKFSYSNMIQDYLNLFYSSIYHNN